VTSSLTATELAKIVDAAIAQWAASGLSAADVAKMEAVSISIANLPNSELGWATQNGITIDDDAAGFGWFVDLTPNANEEYALSRMGQLVATNAAAGHMDLLTVVMHELGHTLGLSDSSTSTGLMRGTLSTGLRRTTDASLVDAVLASDR
jgi:large repetitive protein